MTSLPFPITGTITDSGGSVAGSVTVYARNETNNESISVTTNSSGEYTLDLANFSSGYLTSDYVTIYCSFQSEYAESTILISDGTHTVNLTLASITNPGTINYCSVSMVWRELDDVTSSDISARRVVESVQRAESEIDTFTETKFVSTTVSDEILAWNEDTAWRSVDSRRGRVPDGRQDYRNYNNLDTFRLKNRPLLSLTSLERNTAGDTSTDSWSSLTEQSGSGGDFVVVNERTSEITFFQNFPYNKLRSVRANYTYGTSSVPKNVERLTVLLAVKEILLSKMHSSQFEGVDPVSLESVNLGKGISGSTTYLTALNTEIDNLYMTLPRYKSDLV